MPLSVADALSIYEEKQQELALLERLTKQALISLRTEGHKIRAPAMATSSDGRSHSEGHPIVEASAEPRSPIVEAFAEGRSPGKMHIGT